MEHREKDIKKRNRSLYRFNACSYAKRRTSTLLPMPFSQCRLEKRRPQGKESRHETFKSRKLRVTGFYSLTASEQQCQARARISEDIS
jgi:hypothetical protein